MGAGFLANIATSLGIPVALGAFLLDRYRGKKQRELATFTELSAVTRTT